MVAECRDGIGKYAEWLKQAGSPREVIERFECEGFTRDHSSKAFMCARALEHYSVNFYCSGIDADELEQMFFHAAQSAQEAVDRAVKQKGTDARVLVLPQAVSCVPRVRESKSVDR